MWHMLKTTLQPGQIDHYRIAASDGSVLSYTQVIELWCDDPDFTGFFSGQLAANPFSAYLWETPPVTRTSIQRPFECVLVDSPRLARAAPDANAFSEHFKGASGRTIVDFENLGGDARLIAPCPLEPVTACTHLAAFLRHAPATATQQLWHAVSAMVTDTLGDQPMWISTCGLGVYWLHVRLDSFPKYYRYVPYQSPEYGPSF